MIPDRHAEIAKRAYSLWELEGRQTGGDLVPSQVARRATAKERGLASARRTGVSCRLSRRDRRLSLVSAQRGFVQPIDRDICAGKGALQDLLRGCQSPGLDPYSAGRDRGDYLPWQVNSGN